MLTDDEILALHRALLTIPSVSGDEKPIADFLEGWLAARGIGCERLGESLLVTCGPPPGEAPLLLFDTHLDTVPPGAGWTRAPFAPTVENGRVYGLGSNDAKAAVAAMLAAFLAVRARPSAVTLALALVEGEETRGKGTENVLAALAARGTSIDAAVVGEPTSLDLAVAQKGLLVLELVARGTACHAAHADALGAVNPILTLAGDLARLPLADLGPAHPQLGRTTLQPTVLRAGEARNSVPGEASAILDLRTAPGLARGELAARLGALLESEVVVRSERLLPKATPEDAAIVRAARAARPAARLYGSPTLSDWALLGEVPAVKAGPGASARSHTADEWVDEQEILAGARFYAALAHAFAEDSSRSPG